MMCVILSCRRVSRSGPTKARQNPSRTQTSRARSSPLAWFLFPRKSLLTTCSAVASARRAQVRRKRAPQALGKRPTSAGPTSCGALMVQLHLGLDRREAELVRAMPCGGVAARLPYKERRGQLTMKVRESEEQQRVQIHSEYPCTSITKLLHPPRTDLRRDAASESDALCRAHPMLSKLPLELDGSTTYAFSSLKAWKPPARRPTWPIRPILVSMKRVANIANWLRVDCVNLPPR